MFKPTTPRIQELAKKRPNVIEQLERLLIGRVVMYLDYGNVRYWARRLGWHIDLKRLHQFLTSFDNVKNVGFYYGTLVGDAYSEDTIKKANQLGYRVRTKPVKLMKISIDASSISLESPDLLKQFIAPSLLHKLDIETMEFLNQKLRDLNKGKTFCLEEKKCNFDVEIARDITIDQEGDSADCFVLWSGDSDFYDPIKELLAAGKKVILFATHRRVASELNDLKTEGLVIFDISKLRNFICYNREIV